MTDNAERKVRQWSLKRNGDPLEPKDVVELVYAFADDQEADHKESMGSLASLAARFDCHEAEANLRDQEIADLQEWRRRSAEGCQKRIEEIVRPLISEGHDAKHQHHLDECHQGDERRMDDPPDSEFLELRGSAFGYDPASATSFKQMIAAWSFTKKVVAIIATAFVVAIVGLVVSYTAAYFASTRAENDFMHIEQTPQPTVTVTVSPSP